MKQGFFHWPVALAAGLLPLTLANAASARNCVQAREWVQERCIEKSVSTRDWRCARAQAWLRDNCDGAKKAVKVAAKPSKREKVAWTEPKHVAKRAKRRGKAAYIVYPVRVYDCCDRPLRRPAKPRVYGATYLYRPYEERWYGGFNAERYWKSTQKNLP
jgi:hypothetical protein